MPNVNAVLNEQIRRLARREITASIKTTRKATAHYRRDIAALKRQLTAVLKEVGALRKAMPERELTPPAGAVQNARLRVDGLRAHRLRLGLSAKEYGKLFDVSALTIYNWENGKTKPRRSLLPRLVAVRGLGKREAFERLGIATPTAAVAGGKRPRGIFKETGEQAILAVVKERKHPLTAEINHAWKAQGRGGKADVLLGKLVQRKILRRTKTNGERGSRYSIV